jgi:hypothetical protein
MVWRGPGLALGPTGSLTKSRFGSGLPMLRGDEPGSFPPALVEDVWTDPAGERRPSTNGPSNG